jgi:hypothetical protein
MVRVRVRSRSDVLSSGHHVDVSTDVAVAAGTIGNVDMTGAV